MTARGAFHGSLLGASALLATAAPALAQPSPADDAFLEGRTLMIQGRIAEACQKFAESLALDPRGGTLLNLAVCREKEGRYATALRLFREARERADKDGRADRVTMADDHIQIVLGLVSWLTVRIAPGADAPDLAVRCDGEDLPREAWGARRPADPGPHTVTAFAAGRAPFEATVQIGEARDAQVVEVPPPRGVTIPPLSPLTPIPGPPAPVPLPSPAARVVPEHPVTARGTPAPPAAAGRPWSTPVGWVALGLGTVALVTGGALGVRAIVDVRDGDPSCPKDRCTTLSAYNEEQDAHTAAKVADVAIPVGAAVAAAGLYLILARRQQDPSAPRGAAGALLLSVAARGASLRGSF